MANTYIALAKTVLTSSAASITFSSISATYTDLCVLISARTNSSAGSFVGTLAITYNGITINDSVTELFTDGTNVSSQRSTTSTNIVRVPADGCTANTFGNAEIIIPNYASSSYKPASGTSVIENNSTTTGESRIATAAGLWSDTSAISSITLTSLSGHTIDAGSSFYLYGIKNS
jgi:hypothetical protein